MHHLTRIALAGACALLLGGWKWATLELQPPASAPTTYAYTFKDTRPKKWLKSGIESAETTNCAYGALRYGDNDINPHLPVYLHAMLAQRFGDKLAGKTVDLRGFSVHVNKAVEMRREAVFIGGPIQSALNGLHKEVGCSPEDTFGSYTEGEVPSQAPVIVAIDVFIDGQRFKGRAITPGETAPWALAVNALLPRALENLGDRIDHAMFGGPEPAGSQAMAWPPPAEAPVPPPDAPAATQ